MPENLFCLQRGLPLAYVSCLHLSVYTYFSSHFKYGRGHDNLQPTVLFSSKVLTLIPAPKAELPDQGLSLTLFGKTAGPS